MNIRALSCNRCGEDYNLAERQPVILPDCGHTFCEYCIADLLSTEEDKRLCGNPSCMKPVVTTDLERFFKNEALLAMLQNNAEMQDYRGQQEEQTGQVMCGRHMDKYIEYFCKTCTNTVCVRCIFDEHNGHELVQIEEMSNSLKQNVLDLQKMILNASRLNDENSKLLDQTRDELQRLKLQQMKNIDRGFAELQKKLEEKKLELKNEFEKRFRNEEQKFLTKMSLIATNFEEISNIQKIFDELLQFIDNSPDAKILQKATDMTTFMHKSFTDLDVITKSQISQKSEIYIHPSFRPLTLNVRKAVEIVNKFQMVPPAGAPVPAFDAAHLGQLDDQRMGLRSQGQMMPKVQSLASLGQAGRPQQPMMGQSQGLSASASQKRFQPAQGVNLDSSQDKAIQLILNTTPNTRKNILAQIPAGGSGPPSRQSQTRNQQIGSEAGGIL